MNFLSDASRFRRRLRDRSAIPIAPAGRCRSLLHGGDRCAGFGYQKVKALLEAPATRAQAGPRLYTFNADTRFQRLRRLMEDEWVPQLTSLLNIPLRDLPMIWDADFMLGPPNPDGTDSYVLGEINVSSVFPVPDEAPEEIARRVADRLRSNH